MTTIDSQKGFQWDCDASPPWASSDIMLNTCRRRPLSGKDAGPISGNHAIEHSRFEIESVLGGRSAFERPVGVILCAPTRQDDRVGQLVEQQLCEVEVRGEQVVLGLDIGWTLLVPLHRIQKSVVIEGPHTDPAT